jgi:hypothetical protein
MWCAVFQVHQYAGPDHRLPQHDPEAHHHQIEGQPDRRQHDRNREAQRPWWHGHWTAF